MRKASVCVAMLGLIVLAVPSVSSAEPTASIAVFIVKPVPIPNYTEGGTWPKTGRLGKGTALQVEYRFEGQGYGPTAGNPKGGIPPISQLNFSLPAAVRVNPTAFASCSEMTLKNSGPSGCPSTSKASPTGETLGEVVFGTERVPEKTELLAFFGAEPGSMLFYEAGHTPVPIEAVWSGHHVKSPSPYGDGVITLVPPVATVPDAALASIERIRLTAGAATKAGKKIVPYFTLPHLSKKQCKAGQGLPFKTEVTFGGKYGGEREFGIEPKTVTATYNAPCP
jgi:hypothetical protein